MWLGLAVALAGAPAAATPEATVWYVVVADDGAPIGHASREVTPGPDGGRRVVETQDVELREQAGPSTRVSGRTVVEEDAAGRTLSISTRSDTGRSWSRADARIEPGRAEVVRQTASEKRTVVVALPAGVRFDGGEGLLRGWDPAVTPRLEFDAFDIDALAVEHVVIEAAARDPDGAISALRRRYDRGALSAIARLRIDREGRLVEISQPMFGTAVHVRVTDRATALKPHPPYRVLPTVMTRSPYKISSDAAKGHVRYQFGFRDGYDFALPQTGEQRVAFDHGAATVDICVACGPGLSSDPDYLADALRPTAWLQSDHARLKAIAGPVARMKISDTRKMELLAERARPYLERLDFIGHFSALDTLSRRAGDCTEAAVLLAALGRSAGIPTRVVNGVVYSRERYHGVGNVFMPHSWTLAFVDGEWRSFDMALDGFDSTHVALTVGDGDARSLSAAAQLASLLRWDAMTEVRTSR
nr:transglutaminase-like domain-containing protein [Caulobacter sp. 17J65-9]